MYDFMYKKKSYLKKALKGKTTLFGALAFASFIAFFVAFWNVSLWLLLFFILAIVFTCMYLHGKWVLKHGTPILPSSNPVPPFMAPSAMPAAMTYAQSQIPAPAPSQIMQEPQRVQTPVIPEPQTTQPLPSTEHKISEPQVQVSKVAEPQVVEPQVVEPQVQADATDSVNEPEKTGFVMPDYDDDYDFKVSGTSFRKENFYDILSEDYFWDMTKGELVELGMIDEPIYKYENGGGEAKLIPEPDNQYDPDAIAVYVDDTHVGYVPSKKCAKVKRLLDSGTIVYAFAEIYGGPFKIIRENDDDKYTISKKDHDFGVQVTLYIKNKE